MLIPEWGQTTLFTNGIHHPDAEQRAARLARRISIEETPALAVSGARATMQLMAAAFRWRASS